MTFQLITNIKISNLELYINNILDNMKKYFVIRDIHTCVNELKNLLIKVGYNIDNDDYIRQTEKTNDMEIVIIGDYIDKGNNTKDIIEFIHKNLSIIHIVKGNHEVTTYRALTENQEIIKKFFFNSYEIIKNNEDIKNNFFNIYKRSHHFLKYQSINKEIKSFIITHSPCEEKYLEKLDNDSISKQIKFNVDYEKDIMEQLNIFISNEKIKNHPYHICGHIGLNEQIIKYNQIYIDTGCIDKNKLTGVIMGTFHPTFISTPYIGNDDKYKPKSLLNMILKK